MWIKRFLLPICLPLPLSAQPQSVGRVEKIIPSKVEQPCLRRPARSTPGVRRRRGDVDSLLKARDTTVVLLDDAYFVGPLTDVLMRLTTDGFGKGEFVLAPQILCTIQTLRTTFVSDFPADTGRYEVLADQGELVLGVLAGGAVIHWNRPNRNLKVVIGGHVTTIKGTDLAVRAADTVAVLYVMDGEVQLSERDGNRVVRAGEIVAWSGTASPAGAIRPTGDELRLVNNDVGWHRPTVQRSRIGRLVRNPVSYVVVGGAAALTAYEVCSHREDSCGVGHRKKTGTVTVTIPF